MGLGVELDGPLLVDNQTNIVYVSLRGLVVFFRRFNVSHGSLQIVHVEEHFGVITNIILHDLDEGVNHQDKQQWREGITLDDAVCQADLPNMLLRPICEANLPSRHHLGDHALGTKWEAMDFQKLVQKVVVDGVIRLLEVIVQLHSFRLLSPIHQVEGRVLEEASFHPWEYLTPLCSHSMMLLSPLRKRNFCIRLWMASVTI